MTYKYIGYLDSSFTVGKLYKVDKSLKKLSFSDHYDETDDLGFILDDNKNIRRNPLYYGGQVFERVYVFKDYYNQLSNDTI